MNENYDFREFDKEFKPQQGIRPALDTLPDNAYDFEILDAELTRAQNGDAICNLGLKVNGGAVVQHTYWLTRQIGFDRLGYDCGVLGIEVAAPLSRNIPAAVKRLPGLKFKGTKTSRPGKDKTYHDLNITMRTGGKSMPSDTGAF